MLGGSAGLGLAHVLLLRWLHEMVDLVGRGLRAYQRALHHLPAGHPAGVVRLRLDGLGHGVLDIHLNRAAQGVPLQHLLMLVMLVMVLLLLLGINTTVMILRRMVVKVLLSCGLVGFLLLHLDLVLDASDLVADEHGVRLDLLAHLKGLAGGLRVTRLDHLAHVDLGLGQVHQFEVRADLQLLVGRLLRGIVATRVRCRSDIVGMLMLR